MPKRTEHSPVASGQPTSRLFRGTIVLCLDPAAQSVLSDDIIELSRLSSLRIITEDLETLSTTMQQADPVPDCLIIALGDNARAALMGLERLAYSVPEHTRVFSFGPINDVEFYRALLDLGVEDYFVGPISAEIIGVILSRLDASDPADSGVMIGIQGVAGGVGTSTFALNLAAYFSFNTDRSVSILETGDDLRSYRYLLNPTRLASLSPVDDTSFEEVIVDVTDKHNKGSCFRLTMPGTVTDLPTGSDKFRVERAQADHVSLAMRRRTNREIVVFDLGGSPDPSMLLAHCDHVILVAEPDFKCLALCRRQVNDAKARYPYATLHLVITQSGIPNRTEFRKSDFENETGIPVLSAYRYHASIWSAAMAQGLPFLPSSLLRDPEFFETLLIRMGLDRFRKSNQQRGLLGTIRSFFDRLVRREV